MMRMMFDVDDDDAINTIKVSDEYGVYAMTMIWLQSRLRNEKLCKRQSKYHQSCPLAALRLQMTK
jgi:hypothetical protein